MPKRRDEKRVEQIEIIRRWRWTARKYRQRARIVLDADGLWGAAEALTFDARAWILEQCARDLWRHMQGREVWPPSPEMAALIKPLKELKEMVGEVFAEQDLQRQMHRLKDELGLAAGE